MTTPAARLLGAGGALVSLPVRLGAAMASLVALAIAWPAGRIGTGGTELAALFCFAAWVFAAVPVAAGVVRALCHVGRGLNPYYLDLFVGIALLGCFAGGRYATGALLAVVLVLGQVLEERSVRGMREAVAGLGRLSRIAARRLRRGDGGPEMVDAERVVPGDRVRVLPGEMIPVDGIVRVGESAVNQATVTGESLPRDVAPGAGVFAGTMNLTGPIEVDVERAAGDSVIGRVSAILAAAQEDKPLSARRVDACLAVYTPAVLMVCGATWMLTRDLDRAVSVLVVCLPCAFVLAGPSVMVAALAVCARLGVLVKTPRHFETATRLDTVVFDKTGTLTRGDLAVESVEVRDGVDPAELARAASTLAATSQHPVARAVAAWGEATGGANGATVEGVVETAGRGLRGRVAGKDVLLGNRAWMQANGVACGDDASDGVAEGRRVFVACDGERTACMRVSDTVRAEAAGVVSAMREAGLGETVLLTGDHENAAATVARAAGIGRFRAECLPEDKLAEVRRLRAEGRRVLVVGDGVNDALALAAGDIGVALNRSGAHIAVQTADVAVLHEDLSRLVDWLRVSRRAMRLMEQNLIGAGVVIAVSLVLTTTGMVGPLAAAVLHEGSAFLVLVNSARLLRYEPVALTPRERDLDRS
ncbi:cation-translocating P-type ATPase [Opitutales bacterium ASA1]|nr:cation-translocating P-type ATPase [Opitutales bacterium ASA1]